MKENIQIRKVISSPIQKNCMGCMLCYNVVQITLSSRYYSKYYRIVSVNTSQGGENCSAYPPSVFSFKNSPFKRKLTPGGTHIPGWKAWP